MIREFAIFLVILGVIFTMIGGIIDMSGKKDITISKNHLWNDGTYVTLLAIAILLLNKQ